MYKRQTQLQVACQQVWDPFFNTADRLSRELDPMLAPLDVDPGGEADRVADVDRLREEYGDLWARDIVMSEATVRARHRLEDLSRAVAADETVAPEPVTAPDDGEVPTPFRHRVALHACRALHDGSAHYTASLDPVPTLHWERGFRAFEAMLYTPSADRLPLEHGLFTWTDAPGTFDVVAASLQRRVHYFEQSLV